jgi:hypothetical protein
MSDIPPIPRHEFYKRFYAREALNWPCLTWLSRHCPSKGHCSEALSLLPRKVSILDENSDSRESFWGIYAREEVCISWVLLYNFVCLVPPLIFLVLWLFRGSSEKDMQDSSVPFTLVLGMASVFWSVFLSSLQFGRVD